MAEAIALELLEADLADQLGAHLDPGQILGPGPPAWRPRGATLAEAVSTDQGLELLHHRDAFSGGERGGVTDVVEDALVVVQTQ